ncbi:MAG: hypothetical protein ACJAZH_001678 [Roseivirga sp.]|jgi:hypothetical protein
MKLELLKSRVLQSFIESCSTNFRHEIKAENLIRILKEKNLVLNDTLEKRELSLAVLEEVPNLLIGISLRHKELISVEGYRLMDAESFILDIQKHLPYLRQFKVLSA